MDNAPNDNMDVVLKREALYHALYLCGDQLKATHFDLTRFLLTHIRSNFYGQQFMVKRRIADVLRGWNAEIIADDDCHDWAYGAQCSSPSH